jgi:YidC/Oxa1 family membrane protein insertase
MDRKSIIILICSFVLLMVWYPMLNKLYPPKPLPQTNALARASNQLALSTNAASPAALSANTNANASPAVPAAVPAARTTVPEQLLVVTNQNGYYTFTSRGGGLKLIELQNYPDTIACGKNTKVHETNYASLNTRAPIPILALVNGEALEGDGHFDLKPLADGVRAEKILPSGLSLVKEFHLGTNYLFIAKIRLENTSTNAIFLAKQEWNIGTATPLSIYDPGTAVGAFWYNGTAAEHIQEGWFANRTLGCIPGTPRTEFQGGANNVVWAAVHNQFFALAVVPKDPAPGIVSRRIELPPPSPETLAQESKAVRQPVGYQTALVYPSGALAPGQSMEKIFTVYAGPKEYNTLAKIGLEMKNDLDAVMDFGGFFGFFAKMLLLSMRGLVSFGLTYGWAIVIITVIIKLLFWPLTLASTRSMKRMQTLQPQMKELQNKYKDDPKKQQQKLMEFYKEHKINPVGSCLPILLQIPVFFGFYRMLQSAIELRGATFLWACDLSKPDTILFLGGFPINPFPLIMGVTMLYQARLTPASPGMDPAQQKIMKYMPLMFMVFLYNMSAGLTLYWTVQNLLTIVQTKVTSPGQDPADAKKNALPANPPRKKK